MLPKGNRVIAMARKKAEEDEEMSESWLLPYADLLTLLFALFIVLFAMSEVDVQKFDRLADVFKSEFSAGGGVIDNGASILPENVPTVDIPPEESEDDGEGDPEGDELEDGDLGEVDEEDLSKLLGHEFEALRTMQQKLEEYITVNSLTDTLGTKLTAEGLLVTISTDLTFDSGSADVKEEGKDIAKKIGAFLDTDPPNEIVVSGHADDIPMRNNVYASNWELSSMRAIQFLYLLLAESEIDPKWFSTTGYGEFRPVVPNDTEKNRAINRRVEVLIQPNYDRE